MPAARLQAMYANAHRERGDPAYPVTDFMPFFQQPDPDEPVNLDDKFRKVLGRIDASRSEGSE